MAVILFFPNLVFCVYRHVLSLCDQWKTCAHKPIPTKYTVTQTTSILPKRVILFFNDFCIISVLWSVQKGTKKIKARNLILNRRSNEGYYI